MGCRGSKVQILSPRPNSKLRERRHRRSLTFRTFPNSGLLDDAQEALPFWAQYWRALYATARAWAHKGENRVHAFEVLADVAKHAGISQTCDIFIGLGS